LALVDDDFELVFDGGILLSDPCESATPLKMPATIAIKMGAAFKSTAPIRITKPRIINDIIKIKPNTNDKKSAKADI